MTHGGSNDGEHQEPTPYPTVRPPDPRARARAELDGDHRFACPGEPRVVVVSESEEALDTHLACGQITGAGFEDDEDGQMVVGVPPLGDSGVSGFAVFEQDTQAINVFGEDVSGVTAYLFRDVRTLRGDLEAGATPVP